MKDSKLASLKTWLVEPLPRDVTTSLEKLRRHEDVVHLAVMPDVHLSQEVCIGIAMATRQRIYPAAIGGDIGCGMAAVAVQANATELDHERRASVMLDKVRIGVPSNKHVQPRSLPESCRATLLADAALQRHAERDGSVQFGTLGRGNHFLEFQADGDDRLWIMVHSGSRAMGQFITRHHVGQRPRTGRLMALDALEEPGQRFLADVAWARAYAAHNRMEMLVAVEALLLREFAWSVDWNTLIDNDHNHVQWEVHDGQGQWVHRKGAQAVPSETSGLVPGSMGTRSFHVVGRGNRAALDSCAHGAGRRLSRGHAGQKISRRVFDREMQGVWHDPHQANRLLDEAPSAYKDIRAVMRAQRELVRITRELRPILNYKGV